MSKTLYLIGGTMGVGKTTVSQVMKKQLPNAVFLDGDWCWDADPFVVTEETQQMVLDNITHQLQNFLRCSVYENVIFCWVMHQQAIIDSILGRLDLTDCELKNISLLANEENLRARLLGDVERGVRAVDVVERSVARIPLYRELATTHVETDGKTVSQIAEEIMLL